MSQLNIEELADILLSFESITHKKLQKLCYYVQVWHLAIYNKPLVNEKFEAWVHGPVSRSLYHKYKNYGWQKIPSKDLDKPYEDNQIDFINYIYEMYGDFSGDQLEHMTHEEDPWLIARDGLAEMEKADNIIDEKIMKEYYKNAIEN